MLEEIADEAGDFPNHPRRAPAGVAGSCDGPAAIDGHALPAEPPDACQGTRKAASHDGSPRLGGIEEVLGEVEVKKPKKPCGAVLVTSVQIGGAPRLMGLMFGGGPMICERKVGHDGRHRCGCGCGAEWGSKKADKK